MGGATLLPDQVRALERLSALPALGGFYLAGGSALTCHLGHRISRDLDLFTDGAYDADAIEAALVAVPGVTITARTTVTVQLKLEGTAVDIVRSPYPLVEPPTPGPAGIPLAAVKDLGAMKLSTIASRGLRRDFWDLYEIVRSGLGLTELAGVYVRKYGFARSDLYHVARSLTYFADAERDREFPLGLTAERWEEIKAFFRAEAPKLIETS